MSDHWKTHGIIIEDLDSTAFLFSTELTKTSAISLSKSHFALGNNSLVRKNDKLINLLAQNQFMVSMLQLHDTVNMEITSLSITFRAIWKFFRMCIKLNFAHKFEHLLDQAHDALI